MSIAGFVKVGVVGAGQMGNGIAQVFATYNLEVVLCDINKNQLEIAQEGIKKSLEKLASKGIIAQSSQTIMQKLRFSTELNDLADCELVVEAVSEDESLKIKIFQQLDQITRPETILASNTSSIPITRLASATKRPEKVIGLHFMNPVPIMKLVEIIPGMATDQTLVERIWALVEGIEKEVSTSQDYPGFVVNRILMPMINEAFTALMEGVASAEDIDKGMKLGTNQPMGPLTLADFIGLDTCLAIMKVLHAGLGDSKYRPCPLLVKYVEAGYLGRKSGRGVYHY